MSPERGAGCGPRPWKVRRRESLSPTGPPAPAWRRTVPLGSEQCGGLK